MLRHSSPRTFPCRFHRNISEGSGAAATSKKTEIHLTNVARASLSDELLKEYRSFLNQRGLRVWEMQAGSDMADVADLSNVPGQAPGEPAR